MVELLELGGSKGLKCWLLMGPRQAEAAFGTDGVLLAAQYPTRCTGPEHGVEAVCGSSGSYACDYQLATERPTWPRKVARACSEIFWLQPFPWAPLSQRLNL